jgi:hypothetical protein
MQAIQALAGENLSFLAKQGGTLHMEGAPETYSSTYPIYLSELKDSAINPRPEVTPSGFQSVDANSATFTVIPLVAILTLGGPFSFSLVCSFETSKRSLFIESSNKDACA